MLPRLLLLWAALAAANAQTKADIAALDKRWSDAIIKQDTAALDKLLASDLVYGHASGVLDTKATYLSKIKEGKQVYKSFDQRSVTVNLYKDSAVTHSWARVTGINPQGNFDDKIMMLHIWVKQGNEWRLAAHQTARVDKLP
jgi:ketosteroid isomerase-like protein